MSILSDNAIPDTPAFELYMLLSAFDRAPEDKSLVKMIKGWAQRNLKKCTKVYLSKTPYIGVRMHSQGPSWGSHTNRVVVASGTHCPADRPGQITSWDRYENQIYPGWCYKALEPSKPIISSNLDKCKLSHVWALPEDIFEELYKLMNNYGNTI